MHLMSKWIQFVNMILSLCGHILKLILLGVSSDILTSGNHNLVIINYGYSIEYLKYRISQPNAEIHKKTERKFRSK